MLLLAALPGAWAAVTDPLQNDAGRGGDAGDSFEDATFLADPDPHPGGAVFAGKLVAVDDPEDWYSFRVLQASPDVPITVGFVASSNVCVPSGVVSSGVSLVIRVALVDPNRNERAAFETTDCYAQGQLFASADKVGEWRVAFTYHARVSVLAQHDAAETKAAYPAVTVQADAGGTTVSYAFDPGCKPMC